MTNTERDIAEMLDEALKQWEHCLHLAYRAPDNLKPQLKRITEIREHALKLGLALTVPTKTPHDQLAKEAAEWDNGTRKVDASFVNTPEAIPTVPKTSRDDAGDPGSDTCLNRLGCQCISCSYNGYNGA